MKEETDRTGSILKAGLHLGQDCGLYTPIDPARGCWVSDGDKCGLCVSGLLQKCQIGGYQVTHECLYIPECLVPLLGRDLLSKLGAAAAAKSLQSCPTLCDPMDCSLPGSSIHGIFQARVLEWVAIAFSCNCIVIHQFNLLLWGKNTI